MKRDWLLIIAGLAASVALVGAGCSPKLGNVDVAAGEYLSEDEYEALSNRKKNAYCNALEESMARAQAEFEAKTLELRDTRNLIQSIRRQIVPIETEVRRLDADIRTLNTQIEAVEALPKKWKVRPGDTLTSIAMQDEVYNDIDMWEYIFSANLDKIDDPYYIFPDTVLVIPRDFPVD